MESKILETMKEEPDDCFEYLSSSYIKTEPEDGDTKDIDINEYAMKRDIDDGKELEESFSLPTKSEPDFERESEETNMEENFEVAENTWNMESKENVMKRENDEEEALMEPAFVPVNVGFEGTSEETNDMIFEEIGCTEEYTNRMSGWPHMGCGVQITSSSGSPSDEAVGLSAEEYYLSKNCCSSELESEVPFAVASCSTASWGYMTERQGGKQGVRQRQHSNLKKSGRGASVDGTLLKREMQKSVSLRCSSEKSVRMKVFECSICRKQFAWKFQLTAHMHIHSGERSYNCSHCDKSFRQRDSLSKHMLIHTGEKPYKCSQCEKSFSRRSHLTLHMCIHTGEKPHKCSKCEKSFSQRCNLIAHIRLHTGEKPYKCSHCDKSFHRNRDLSKHMFSHK